MIIPCLYTCHKCWDQKFVKSDSSEELPLHKASKTPKHYYRTVKKLGKNKPVLFEEEGSAPMDDIDLENEWWKLKDILKKKRDSQQIVVTG